MGEHTKSSIVQQAQVFASAWSLIGGIFDSGHGLEDAEEAKRALAEMVGTVVQQRDDLLAELRAAHQIIRNALNLMTTEQKAEWGRANERDGVAGEGVTRANEREAVIKRAEGRS